MASGDKSYEFVLREIGLHNIDETINGTADKMFAFSFHVMISVYVTRDHKSLCVNKVAFASCCNKHKYALTHPPSPWPIFSTP